MSSKISKLNLPTAGMSCASCALTVEKALKHANGVKNAAVNFANHSAQIEIEKDLADVQNLVNTVKDAGYDVDGNKIDLAIKGMSCAACVRRVEMALKNVPGVFDASVNLSSERASISYLPGIAGTEMLKDAVAEAGYEAEAITDEGSKDWERANREQRYRQLYRNYYY